jgi:hypothetical protein
MAKAKKKSTKEVSDIFNDIMKASMELPSIEKRNKKIHKEIIKTIKNKFAYQYSEEGQFITREGLLQLMPDLDEQTITSALIDMPEIKIIDSISTIHFPAHYFK